MSAILTLLTSRPYLTMSQYWLDQVVLFFAWCFLGGFVVILLYYWRSYITDLKKNNLFFWLVLIACVPVSSLFIGVRLPSSGALPPPNVPIDPEGPALMVFSFLPWIIAGGIIGPVQAMVIAFLSGCLLAFWGNHVVFTPWTYALIAVIYCVCMMQRYRTVFYKFLRHPICTGFLLVPIFPFVYILSTPFLVSGNLAIRLDYAISNVPGETYAFAGSLLIACLFAELFILIFPAYWSNHKSLLPSPAEKSLEIRFLYRLIPLAVFLILVLVIGTWQVAESTSKNMVQERLINISSIVGEGIPYFLETGQNLTLKLAADQRLYSSDALSVETLLQEHIREVPFFNQLYILNPSGNSIAGYPDPIYEKNTSSAEEQYGILRALDGVPFQFYPRQPPPGKSAAYLVFYTPLLDNSKDVRGVLVGFTDLLSNPITQPLIESLKNLEKQSGYGMLLDENGRILYHKHANLVLSQYSNMRPGKSGFYEEPASDGTRHLVLYQRTAGWPWLVVLSVPFQAVQQNAISIATPIAAMVMFLSGLAAVYFHFNIRNITTSLRRLADHASMIYQGTLDHPVKETGEDEVAGLSKAFEQMRIGLKSHLEDQDRLLWVSQGVASSLDLDISLEPVLISAMSYGACSSRIVLSTDALPELAGEKRQNISFTVGPGSEKFMYLDDQILTILDRQDRIILNHPNRPKLFSYPIGVVQPEALWGMPIYHENIKYGGFWVIYDQPHVFNEDEVRFLATLTGHAALGIANSSHFLNAEVGRRRLEAILNSTPDPVLVIDQQDRLILGNPAAWQALGMENVQIGLQVNESITNPELVKILQLESKDEQPREISLADGRIYFATVSNVLADHKHVGRVCVMRDITYFKELDELKTDFVHTVSHDLRSPLSVIKGYTTMLDMVGNLNEQQGSYVKKILGSIENMTDMVTNLLDLGRIEAGVGLRLELFSLSELLEHVVSELQIKAAQKRLQLALKINVEDMLSIEADRALLKQAFHNLVDNAIQFTGPNGDIWVGASEENDRAIIEVHDNGIGIAHVDQSRVFDKFYRVTQPDGKRVTGTGLGLAIVKSVAERHGGEVWLESQLGKGSVFYVSLPLKQTNI